MSFPFEHTVYLEEGRIVFDKLLGDDILVKFFRNPEETDLDKSDFILDEKELNSVIRTFNGLKLAR